MKGEGIGMIYSSFRAQDDPQNYPQALRVALDYLRSRDFTQMECGTYPIRGKEIYALVQQITTCPVEEKRPESHKKYIDVQYVVTGKEKMGVLPKTGQETVVSSKEESDIYFYGAVENESFITAQDGDYCIFFPEDIHRPGCMVDGPEPVRKVVVKVSMDALHPDL